MTHSSRTRKKDAVQPIRNAELNMNVPGIAKLIDFAEELSASSAQTLQKEAEFVAGEMAIPDCAPPKRKMTAPEAAQQAGKQITELTRLNSITSRR